jgi:membrane protease YdiL (CAAX protease family)
MSLQGTYMKKSVTALLALVEIGLMVLLIVCDVLIPSLLIAAVGYCFLLVRKEKTDLFNTKIWKRPVRLILCTAGLGFALSVFDYCLVIPVVNHLTNSTQDMSSYENIKGNTGLMMLLLAYSWLIAALPEEFAYRGFFQNRIISLFPNRTAGLVVAVLSTSALFGVMHGEQGLAGMITTALDAVFLSVVRYRYKNVWSAVLVHGFSNMIGIVTFYFTGPLNGLW